MSAMKVNCDGLNVPSLASNIVSNDIDGVEHCLRDNIAPMKDTVTINCDRDSSSLDSGCECSSSNGSGKLDNSDMNENCVSNLEDVIGPEKFLKCDRNDIAIEQYGDHKLTHCPEASMFKGKEYTNSRLKEELFKVENELKRKDEECKKLTHVQDQMSEELEELTARLFEEANKMVQDANIKRMNSEKLLQEATNKIEVLQAEVTALKTLVITSTPSMPNKHLHPQLTSDSIDSECQGFVKGHRRSTSHHNFSKEMRSWDRSVMMPMLDQKRSDDCVHEIDPVLFEEFQKWRNQPTLKKDAIFMSRIMKEDISPCMAFTNTELSQRVYQCVMSNTLSIEPVIDRSPFPRRCALTQATRICKYRIKLADSEPYNLISQLARNRIAAVCDFLTYARYITQGLVKTDENSMYWEIMRLRKQISLARLGFS